jgi:hypothetical protein
MEMLEGRTLSYHAYNGTVPEDNEFIRRETWMQIQDILTGQVDRHGGNVMLTAGGPVAIDHDLAFPTNPPRSFAGTVPWRLVQTIQTLRGPRERAIDDQSWRNYCMPPVIDREMYTVIMAMDLREFAVALRECGLTKPEIGAAMERARGLQAAAQQLMDQGRVIEPDQWEDAQQVRNHCNEQNFYALRYSRRSNRARRS